MKRIFTFSFIFFYLFGYSQNNINESSIISFGYLRGYEIRNTDVYHWGYYAGMSGTHSVIQQPSKFDFSGAKSIVCGYITLLNLTGLLSHPSKLCSDIIIIILTEIFILKIKIYSLYYIDMVEIDNERLTQLMELCKQEYPDIDPFIIWVYSMDYLLNEQGIYGDKIEAQKLYEQARGELKFNVRVE